METIYYIYKITSPNGKTYVGLTDDFGRRMKEHERSPGKTLKKGQHTSKLINAIKKYKFDNLKKEVIMSCFGFENAKLCEIELVKFYDSFKNGYNLTAGGDSNPRAGKLNKDQVEEIRDLLENTSESLNVIAEKYGVSDVTVIDIQYNRRWKYMGNARKIYRKKPEALRGSKNPTAKLNEEQVRQMKIDSMEGMSRKDIKEKYEISKTLVALILTEETWKHVKVEGYEYKAKRNGNAKLDVEKVRLLWKDRLEGKSISQLKDEYKVSRSTVENIIKGKVWRDVYEEFN